MTIIHSQDLTLDGVCTQLRAGADHVGERSLHAAVHLLTGTELVGDARFVGEFLTPADVPDEAGGQVPAMFVADWAKVRDSFWARRAGSGAECLLTLACALATGEPVNIQHCLTELDSAAGTRFAEAVQIMTGV